MAETIGVVNGNNVLLYVNDTAVACSTNAEVSYTNELIEVTCKDNGGAKQYLLGSGDWNMTLEMFVKYDATFGANELWDLALNKTTVEAMFSNENAGDFRLVGDALITAINNVAPLNGGVTASVTLQGTSTLTKEVIT
jgi:predicted secreted protein